MLDSMLMEAIMEGSYDYRNCTSLFGYAAGVHLRSGGICQYCGAGDGEEVDFDLWRQLTVEHLIGESQGGHKRDIRAAVHKRFRELLDVKQEAITKTIDEMNTISACHFCNATTSRMQNQRGLDKVIAETPGDPEAFLESIQKVLKEVLERKRDTVQWKLGPVREAFNRAVLPELLEARRKMGHC
jgi:hypothetical protein